MAVFYRAEHGVLREPSHTFLVGASVKSTIPQDCIPHGECLTFGVVRSQAC
jgi:hypothetical protein